MELPLLNITSFTKVLFDFLDVSSFMIRQVLRESPRFSFNALSKKTFFSKLYFIICGVTNFLELTPKVSIS